jgi:transcriptional regulator with XRE-family HTH domain
MQIGEKISQIRKAKNLTLQQMAKKLDISLTAYASIENNDSDIAISRLQQIAQALGVQEWALFLPEGAVNIIGEIKEQKGGNVGVGINHFPFDFDTERKLYEARISEQNKIIDFQQKTIDKLLSK